MATYHQIRLVPLTSALRPAVSALSLAPGQSDSVAANADSLEEADSDPDARPRVLLRGDEVVGFAMYDASDPEDVRIYRYMIDRAHQGRGLGRAGLKALLADIRAIGGIKRISICYMPDNAAARGLYLSEGFREEGLDEDGEMIAALYPARLPG